MNIPIKIKEEKSRPWLWFVGLWLGSLTLMFTCSYLLKYVLGLIFSL